MPTSVISSTRHKTKCEEEKEIPSQAVKMVIIEIQRTTHVSRWNIVSFFLILVKDMLRAWRDFILYHLIWILCLRTARRVLGIMQPHINNVMQHTLLHKFVCIKELHANRKKCKSCIHWEPVRIIFFSGQSKWDATWISLFQTDPLHCNHMRCARFDVVPHKSALKPG